MNRTAWCLAIGAALGLAAPWMILDASAPEGRRALGLAASPFGSARLLAAHLLLAAPLATAVAAAILRGSLPRTQSAEALAWAAVGLGVSAGAGSLSPAIAGLLDELGAGFVARSLSRSAVALLLVLPWMVPAVRWAGRAALPGVGRPAIGAAVLLAILPPAAFADRLIDSRIAELESHLETGRLARSRALIELLGDLAGEDRPVLGRPLSRTRRGVARQLDRLDRLAERPLAPDSPAEAALERAFLLIQLDRLEEADALLLPSATSDPDAALLRAATLRDLGRWDACDRQYRVVLDRLLDDADEDPAARERCVMAFDGLASAARAAGRPEAAEAAFLEARGRLPDRAAYFAAQLGRHYRDGGRPAAALARFGEALGLDPGLEASLAATIRSVRVATPGCLLRRPTAPPRPDRP